MNATPMKRRQFLQLTAGAIGGATLLAACQPAVAPVASDEAGDDSAAAEIIQLEYLGYEPDEVHGEAFDKFKEVMPEVELLISPTIGSWPDMLAKINARIAAGDPPDIAIVATYGPPRIWSKKGILVDLQPYLDADSDYDDDPVAPALLQLYRVEGKLFGLPKDYVTHAVIYNKGLFDEAGVAYPEDGWTWADCLEMGQQLTSGDGQEKIYGWMTQTGPWANEHWMWANEGKGYFDRWNGDLTTPTANDPKNIEALQWLADTILTHEVSPSPEQLATEGAGSRQLTGRIAMWASHTIDTVNLLKNTDKIDWHVVRNPRAFEDGPTTTMMWTSGFGIVADTEHPDAAFAFLKHMSIGEGALVLGATGFSLPAGRPEGFVTEEMAARGGDVFVDACFNSDLAANDSLGVNHGELLGTAVIPNIEAAFLGLMTADEALNEIQVVMEDILADANEEQY